MIRALAAALGTKHRVARTGCAIPPRVNPDTGNLEPAYISLCRRWTASTTLAARQTCCTHPLPVVIRFHALHYHAKLMQRQNAFVCWNLSLHICRHSGTMLPTSPLLSGLLSLLCRPQTRVVQTADGLQLLQL